VIFGDRTSADALASLRRALGVCASTTAAWPDRFPAL
jgi:hypothetical protein